MPAARDGARSGRAVDMADSTFLRASDGVNAGYDDTDRTLGSRAHIRHTVERACVAIRDARRIAEENSFLRARAAEVADASREAVRRSVESRTQLRESVAAYVRHLRADGLPSERVVVLVKSAVWESTPSGLEVVEARTLMQDVVRWTVEAYYHAA